MQDLFGCGAYNLKPLINERTYVGLLLSTVSWSVAPFETPSRITELGTPN